MPLDGLTLHALLSDIDQKLRNGRIMKIYQPDRHTITMNIRVPGRSETLVVSADPVYPRIHTTDADWENPVSPPAFCMLLRKYIEPSRILRIEQYGFDRVAQIVLEGMGTDGSPCEYRLILEIMGRQSNILLVNEEGVILDAIKRKTPLEAAVDRILAPGEPYEFPPDQGKKDPSLISPEELHTDLRLADPTLPLWKILQNTLQGLSKLAAQEILFRAGVDPKALRADTNDEDWGRIIAAVQDVLAEVMKRQTGSFTTIPKADFAAYDITLYPCETYTSIDSLIDFFYTERVQKADLEQAKSKLRRVLKRHLERVEKKEGLQRQTIADAKQAHVWRRLGELITANLHLISPGAASAKVIDYHDPNMAEITLELDPTLSPSDNAQAMFKKYNKAKKSLDITLEQLEKTEAEKHYLEETLTHVELADSVRTLQEIEQELEREGYIKAQTKGKGRSKPSPASEPEKFQTADGYIILVGRNNRQNDNLTFRRAAPTDLWFHAQKIPGSHVVLKTEGEPSAEAILTAAVLAARHSKAKDSPKVPVDYTQRRHVRKPSGAKPGFVLYESFQTVMVDPHTELNITKLK